LERVRKGVPSQGGIVFGGGGKLWDCKKAKEGNTEKKRVKRRQKREEHRAAG